MAKGLGLIGNFRGKFGNAVGYNLKDSNNKQTQGIRIYQPIVKNPKTYAQAEQRARLAPINWTYRMFKSIIDRGQEGIAYGNKSRLAWLRDAMKSFNGGWFEKGAAINFPALVTMSKGNLNVAIGYDYSYMGMPTLIIGKHEGNISTFGQLSTQLLANYTTLRAGDQITIVGVGLRSGNPYPNIISFLVDAADETALPSGWEMEDNMMAIPPSTGTYEAFTVIVSREGDAGQHLRTTSALICSDPSKKPSMTEAAKEAAIRSYMAAGATTDWPQEPIKD